MKKIILVLLVCLLPVIVWAHPHIRVDTGITVIHENSTLKSIEVNWAWDKLWSSEILMYCDLDNDGFFIGTELDQVYNDYFISLKDFGFFTILKINSKKLKISKVENFQAMSEDGIVYFCFSIPLDQPAEPGTKVCLAFNDETIYTYFGETMDVQSQPKDKIKNIKITTYSFYGIQSEFLIGE